MAVPVVVAQRLSKSYGTRPAVCDISFYVEQGQVLGLLGPNGSGKSTILRILTGFLTPTSGSARVAGWDVGSDSLEVRRRIGYVPEDVPLYGGMFVHEFLRLMGAIKGISGTALRLAVDSVCEKLALSGVRHLTISKLSRGYRQRVAIAQALLGSPALLVLDEPTNGLDPRQIIEMRALIQELARDHTLIVTSHILSEVEHVATHVAILLEGKLLTIAPLRGTALGDRLRFTLAAAPLEDIEACVSRVSGVTAFAPGTWESGLTVEFEADFADTNATAALASALVSIGIGLHRISPARSDLETLFLRLTSQIAMESEGST